MQAPPNTPLDAATETVILTPPSDKPPLRWLLVLRDALVVLALVITSGASMSHLVGGPKESPLIHSLTVMGSLVIAFTLVGYWMKVENRRHLKMVVLLLWLCNFPSVLTQGFMGVILWFVWLVFIALAAWVGTAAGFMLVKIKSSYAN